MYQKYLFEIQKLKQYKNIKLNNIGCSTIHEPIYEIQIGDKSKPHVLFEGCIHAREWITLFLLLKIAKYAANKNLNYYLSIIPCVNPDGFRLATQNLDWITDEKRKQILKIINNESKDFSKWKANINGVDLNTNFNALWGEGKHNLNLISPENYIGPAPFSEIETRVIKSFIARNSVVLCLSYHSKGEVIYYGFDAFNDSQNYRDFLLALKISKVTGYTLVKNEKSSGGLSDYIALTKNIPDITLEVGEDSLSHPITLKSLESIYEKNYHIIDLLNEIIKE